MVDVTNALHRLKAYVEARKFKGYDPYDGLNSPLFKALSFHTPVLRMAFIQGMKRFPMNIRPLLGVGRGYNPKGVGLFLWGYSKLYALEKRPEYLRHILFLLGKLEALRSRKCVGNGWGYNFDWHSRAFFVPRYTPTIVNSAFIGHALLDTWEYVGLDKARQLALPIGEFILRDLNRLEEEGSICFSYTPLDRYFVHNANLIGASLLIRLFKETGIAEYREKALAALAYTMNRQQGDGSWRYAEKTGSHWIDSFHTGFNLQGVRYFLDNGFGKTYWKAFAKGVRFYADNFFLPDGTPKYYHDRVYPIDIHCPAQAVVFFSAEGGSYQELTHKTVRWMLRHMQDRRGYFYFQKRRFYTNRIPYMRWGQAWAFHALTSHLLYGQRN